MEKLSIISLVLISVLIIVVQCHGLRLGGSRNAPAQTNMRGSVGNAARPLFAPINTDGLQGMDRRFMIREPRNAQAPSGPADVPDSSTLSAVNPTLLEEMYKKYMSMHPQGRWVWASCVFNPEQFRGNDLYRKFMNMSSESRTVWAALLRSRGQHPSQMSNTLSQPQNNALASSLAPRSKRKNKYYTSNTGPAPKTQRTQGSGGSRRGNLRIQEPDFVTLSSSSDDSSQYQKDLDLALRLSNQYNRGKSQMGSAPSQYERSGKGAAGTSGQANSAHPSSRSRYSPPGLSLSINENSGNTRAPEQAPGNNNVVNFNDLSPENLKLTLAIKNPSNHNGN